MRGLVLALALLAALPARAQTQVAPPPADEIGPPPPPLEAAPPPAPLEATPPREDSASQQKLSPPDAWQPRAAAMLRVMNKIDSTVNSLSVPVGGTAQFQSLTIKISGCFVRPPDLPADATAHVTITDQRPDQPGLDAWILVKEPAIHMLEHPVYDVQLAGCA